METSFKIPPNISQSLLHEVLLNAAKLNPDYPYILTLNSDVPDSKIEIITYTRFVSDVSQVAKRLQRSIPRRKPGSEIQNVGILARNGYDYAVHWMTCQFNSWSPILLSPRNSREAIIHLLGISGSTHLLVDNDYLSYSQSLELSIPIVLFEDLATLEAKIHTFDIGTLTEAEREFESELPAFYLHTSGSTGHPKLIGQRHGIVAGWLESMSREGSFFDGRVLYPQGPLFHALGSHTVGLFGPSAGSASLIEKTSKPYTASSTLSTLSKLWKFLQQTPQDVLKVKRRLILVTVPSILVDIASAGEDAMKQLANETTSVVFGGAAMDLAVGDLLADHGVNLATGYGMTEIGSVSQAVVHEKARTNGEWRYTPFREGYNYHKIPTGEEGKFQLVVLPGDRRPLAYNHKDPLGFDTTDVFSEHPTMKGFYKHEGRVGDVTVLSNGEKTDNKQIRS